MCDFSLQSVRSRSAKVGDKLVTRNFRTGTIGFAAADDRRQRKAVRSAQKRDGPKTLSEQTRKPRIVLCAEALLACFPTFPTCEISNPLSSNRTMSSCEWSRAGSF